MLMKKWEFYLLTFLVFVGATVVEYYIIWLVFLLATSIINLFKKDGDA